MKNKWFYLTIIKYKYFMRDGYWWRNMEDGTIKRCDDLGYWCRGRGQNSTMIRKYGTQYK